MKSGVLGRAVYNRILHATVNKKLVKLSDVPLLAQTVFNIDAK